MHAPLATKNPVAQLRAAPDLLQPNSLLRTRAQHRIYSSQNLCCAAARCAHARTAKISVAQSRAARTRGAARITHSAGRPGTQRSSPQDLHLTHNNNTLKLPSHSCYLTALFIVLYYLGL